MREFGGGETLGSSHAGHLIVNMHISASVCPLNYSHFIKLYSENWDLSYHLAASLS